MCRRMSLNSAGDTEVELIIEYWMTALYKQFISIPNAFCSSMHHVQNSTLHEDAALASEK